MPGEPGETDTDRWKYKVLMGSNRVWVLFFRVGLGFGTTLCDTILPPMKGVVFLKMKISKDFFLKSAHNTYN